MNPLSPVGLSIAFLLCSLGVASAATVEVSGGDPPPITRSGVLEAQVPVVIGTFAPGFDPQIDLVKYSVDGSNFSSDYYGNMVRAGDFRPIGMTRIGDGGRFSGSFSTDTTAGSRLWLVIWDSPTALDSALVTSFSHDNWVLGGDGSLNRIDLSEADTAIFAQIVNGQLQMLYGLPMPEPSPACLMVAGLGLLAGIRWLRNKG